MDAARKRASGRRAIGMLIPDVPAELIHAAGFYPVGVLGHRGSPGSGREHFQSFTCSYSRSSLDLLLDGSMSFLEGVITPFVCDTTRAVDVVLRHQMKGAFVECYRPLKSLNGRGARKYILGEIKRLKENIEKHAGADIKPGSLKKSIALYNRARGELRRLSPMRETDPGSFYNVCRAFLVLPVEEFIALAEKVKTPIKAKENGIPIVIGGKTLEPGNLAKSLADMGARIVADDLITGARLFEVDLDEDIDPIEAMSDRQIRNIPYAGFCQGSEDRPDYLVRLARENKAAGVILAVQKFCETFEIDTPEVRERLKKEGIPTFMIETDFEPEVSGAMKTRIEAFLEMIKNG